MRKGAFQMRTIVEKGRGYSTYYADVSKQVFLFQYSKIFRVSPSWVIPKYKLLYVYYNGLFTRATY